jgi:hypothetical protein
MIFYNPATTHAFILSASTLYAAAVLQKSICTFVIDQYSDPYGRIAVSIILYTLYNLNHFTLYYNV